MIPLDPMMTVHVADREVGVEAFVVLHTLGQMGAGGGIRCTPDVTVEEVKQLACAMTCKYAFFGLPYGGGKGGMIMEYDTPPERRQEMANCLGQHLRLLLHSGAYSAWTDMNFGPEDMFALYEGANLHLQGVSKGESSERTALSTFASLVSTADALGLPPKDCRVSIEGFGAVGGILAREIDDWGGRLVAASNVYGAVVDPDGLPVAEMLSRREKDGAKFILQSGSWRNAPREQLFVAETDVLVPCARVGSLTEQLARKISARAVVPAANVPCTEGAERILAERKIPLLPDFVVNAGGVLGMMQSEEGRSFFMRDFKEMVDRLLRSARDQGVPPINIARKTANDTYTNERETFFQQPPFAKRVVEALRWRGLLPRGEANVAIRRRRSVQQLVTSYYLA